MQYYIHIIITIIFSLLFPHYYHCPYYPTTITHYWHHAYNHKNDRNNNESDSNDDLKNLWKSKAIKIIASNILWTKDRGENWANKQTKKWEQLVRECAPFTYSSQKQTNQMLHRHVWGVTATFAPVLQHRSWTWWVDVTVWASRPDSASSSSSSLGPQQLLQEQWFEKKVAHVWEGGGVALKDYVVLTRLSSCLMAVRREKKVCHIWELYIISVVYFCFLTKLMYTVRHMQRYCEQ